MLLPLAVFYCTLDPPQHRQTSSEFTPLEIHMHTAHKKFEMFNLLVKSVRNVESSRCSDIMPLSVKLE